MGINQSREDVEPILNLLREIAENVFDSAKDKLQDLSRIKCKLHVTKFELLMILKINAKDVKVISQFISGEKDPFSLDINSVFILLVLTNQYMNNKDKCELILDFVCFTRNDPKLGISGQLTHEEYRYIFQIAYQLLSRISDLDLIANPLVSELNSESKEGSFGCPCEVDLLNQIFGKKGPDRKESAEIQSALKQICRSDIVQSFFDIFKSGKIVDKISKVDGSAQLKIVVSLITNQDDNQVGQLKDNKNIEALKQIYKEDPFAKQSSQNISQINEKQSFPPMNFQSQYQANSQEKNTHNQPLRVQVNPRTRGLLLTNKKVQMEEQIDINLLKLRSSQCIEKMSKRILELRNENYYQLKVYDQNDNHQKLLNNIELILNKNIDFYAQRQLMASMRSYFSQKQSDEMKQIQINQQLNYFHKYQLDSQGYDKMLSGNNLSSAKIQNEVQTTNSFHRIKKFLRNTLESYTQQEYFYLKFKVAEAKTKFMHYYGEGSS